MDVLIASIRHTGTRFVQNLLETHGVENREAKPEAEKGYYYSHIGEGGKSGTLLAALAGYVPTVIPFRHPYCVWEAWRRRGITKPLAERYRVLIDVFLPKGPIVFPLDALHGKEASLERIGSIVGCHLTTDWSPVACEHQTADLDWRDLEPPMAIRDIADEFRHIIQRYYL